MTDQKIFNELFKNYPCYTRDKEVLSRDAYKEYHQKLKELRLNGTILVDDVVVIWVKNVNEMLKNLH